MGCIEINVKENDRIVEIWLTNSEKNDKQLEQSLKPLYQEYKRQKFLVAVYESGGMELPDNTAGLLLHNRMV